jgi:hypothetical protein
MYLRLIAVAGIAAFTLHPATSRAGSDEVALTACEKVFAAGLSTRVVPPAGYRITFANRGYVESEAQFEAGLYSYDIVARDRRNGAMLASATCTVDEHGAITALSYVPLTAAAAALAAR